MAAMTTDREPLAKRLAQLRRIRWGVRGVLAIGVAASVFANILHARHNPISQGIAAWPPCALIVTIELISRAPIARRLGAAVRLLATAGIAGIAAWVSYWHMVSVTATYGETNPTPYLLPLSVDGLVIVASVSLVDIASRIRAMEGTDPTPAPVPAPAELVRLGVARTHDRAIEQPASPPAPVPQTVIRSQPIGPARPPQPRRAPRKTPTTRPKPGNGRRSRTPFEVARANRDEARKLYADGTTDPRGILTALDLEHSDSNLRNVRRWVEELRVDTPDRKDA
jgi:hypothetical protein